MLPVSQCGRQGLFKRRRCRIEARAAKKRGRHEGRTVTAETATLVVARAEPRRMSFGWLWSAALLVILTFLVIYPVAMLLLGALTNTNPVVDGFGVFDISLDQFHHRPRQSERPSGARQLADRLRRRHRARGDHRADLLLGGGAHRHAGQALHRGGEHDPAVRAAAGRRGRLVDPRLAENRACSTPSWRGWASTIASTSTRWAA